MAALEGKHVLGNLYFSHREVEDVLGNELGDKEFYCKLVKWLHTPPRNTILRVNTNKMCLEDAQKKLEELLSEDYPNVFTVHHFPPLNDVLVIPSPQTDNNNSPKNYPEVIVDVRCGSAILRGANIFAPGVLAAPSDLKADEMVSVYVDVKGKCLKGATKKFEGAKIFIGYGMTRLSRKEIFTTQNLRGIAVKMTEPVCKCPSLDFPNLDFIFLQNLPSIVCSHVLNPQIYDSVLDMCAAPGGKTVHLATLMKNQGKVLALDKTQNKIDKIIANATKFGLSNIKVFIFDSTKACNAEIGSESPPFQPETFDKILLDAPCSGLGQRPQFRIEMSVSQIKSYPPLQRKLFDTAVKLLKVGGTLVYSTCTVTLAENERIVEWALNTFPCLQLATQSPYLGCSGLSGTTLSQNQLNLLQRFDFRFEEEFTNPFRQTIGFFIAKFVKIAK